MKKILLSFLFLFVAAGSAAASTSLDPVRIRLNEDIEPALAGAPTQGVIRVELARHAELTDFRLEGRGWTVHRLDAPPRALIAPGRPLEITFEASAADPDQPLVLSWTLEGLRGRRSFSLSPRIFERFREPMLVETIPGSQLPPGTRTKADHPLPDPAPRDPDQVAAEKAYLAELAGEAAAAGASDASNQKAIAYTFTGRVVYNDVNGNERPAHGMTVRVFDDNFPFPSVLMGEDVTDKDGNWQVTDNWDSILDLQADVFVEYISENSHVLVRPNGVIPFVGPYTWRTAKINNLSGSRDFGDFRPPTEDERPVPHILGSGTKAWEFALSKGGYNTPKVTYLYPDTRWAAYNQFFQEIYITPDYDTGNGTRPFQWKEDVQIHEWGHHFIRSHSIPTIPDYCNGNCDDQPMGWIWELDCGHCAWCEENGTDAWAEGWPNWLADMVTANWGTEWGGSSLSSRSYETTSSCFDSDGNACDCDPMLTEGFLSALLRDIQDSTNDDEDTSDPLGVADRLSLGYDEIFQVTAEFDVTSTQAFINLFRATWPQHDQNLWDTAKNIGFELDTSRPARVTSLASSSHPVGGSSFDTTPSFSWERAFDDMSGIRGYSVSITGSASTVPDQVEDIGNVTSWTSSPVAPGTWYMHIRTLDRSGKWSTTAAHYGPFTVQQPDPADLIPTTATGWDWPIVPRPSNDTSSGSVPSPTSTLPTDTWINLYGRNVGQVATSGGFQVRVFVDDVYRYWLSWGAINAGQGFRANNWGPIAVRGGRHTFESRVDALDAVPESNESNNNWAKQWIWAPDVLQVGSPVTRSAPPQRDGGWDAVGDGSTLWFNADGYRLVANSRLNAAVLRSVSTSADFDVRLHTVSSNSTTGFGSNLGFSARPAGMLDAVLTGTANLKSADPSKALANDVGVLNQNGVNSNYVIEAHGSSAIAVDVPQTVTFASGETFHLRHLELALADLQPYTVVVEAPAGETWHVMWFDGDFATGDLLDNDGWSTTDASGFARLDRTPPVPGNQGIVLFRDPVDGLAPSEVQLTVRSTPPDFVAYVPGGWYSPLVPRPANDGSSSSVPAPGELLGDVASTFLNVAVRNDSPVAAGNGLYSRMYVDGTYRWWLSYGNFGAGASSRFNWSSAWTVPGGRHTLSVRHDQDQRYDEIDEIDNDFGEQWIWKPSTLLYDTPFTRSAPPARTAGWDEITTGEIRWYNADGLRTNAPREIVPGDQAGSWAAVAVMPRSTSADVDIRLHEQSTGAKSGFASSAAYSGWGPGASDFVLVNHRQTPRRGFDAGVLRIAGTSSYTAESTFSRLLDRSASESSGPFSLGKDEIVELHEVILDAGTNILHVGNLMGDVDWGLTLYENSEGFLSKAEHVPAGAQASGGDGEDEWLTVDIPRRAYYCIAVWKTGTADLSKVGTYSLSVRGRVTAVDGPGTRPTRDGIASIHPNPFNPQTEVRFELAREQRVELAVYNLRGEHVRTLLRDQRPAGTHEIVWNGRDDGGRFVASGVYLVRLRTSDREEQRKVTLVK